MNINISDFLILEWRVENCEGNGFREQNDLFSGKAASLDHVFVAA